MALLDALKGRVQILGPIAQIALGEQARIKTMT